MDGRLHVVAPAPPGRGLRNPRDPADQNSPGKRPPSPGREDLVARLEARQVGGPSEQQQVLLPMVAPGRLHQAVGRPVGAHGGGPKIGVGPVERRGGAGAHILDLAQQARLRDHRVEAADPLGRPGVDVEDAARGGRARPDDGHRNELGGPLLGQDQQPPKLPVLLRQGAPSSHTGQQRVVLGTKAVVVGRAGLVPVHGAVDGQKRLQRGTPDSVAHGVLRSFRQPHQDHRRHDQKKSRQEVVPAAAAVACPTRHAGLPCRPGNAEGLTSPGPFDTW